MAQHPAAQQTRTLFLRLVAFIFFLALASLYVQWDGLFGMDGIEPALKTINQKHRDNKNKNNQDSNLLLQLFLSNFPTLLTLHTSMGLTIDLCAEFFMVIGMALSLLATLFPKNFAIFPVLFSIQWIYLSFYLVGGTFLSFQWDILLLEIGWLAIAWSPWSPFFLGKESYTSNAAIQWLLRSIWCSQNTSQLSNLVRPDSFRLSLRNAVLTHTTRMVCSSTTYVNAAAQRRHHITD